MANDAATFVAEDGWLLIAIVTFALAGLASMAGLGLLAGPIAVVGWFLLTPIFLFWGEEIAALVFEDEESAAPDERDPFEELKRRYAAGEIDDAEFERRLDRLVDADDRASRTAWDAVTGDPSTDAEEGSRSGQDEGHHGSRSTDGEVARDRNRELERS